MPKVYTSDQLIALVRRRSMAPNTGALASDDDSILEWLNETMKMDLLPFITSLRQDYLVVTEHISLAGVKRTRVPKRASGIKVADLRFQPTGGTVAENIDLQKIARENAWRYGTGDTPRGFYFEAVDIVFVPDGAMTGTLVCPYYFQPGDLVDSDNYRTVTAVSGSDVTISDTIPSGWTTSNLFDVHSPDSGAEMRVWSATCSAVGGTTLTFTTAIDGSTQGTKAVAVGDYVCLEREAAVPALPRELHPLLGLCTAAQILNSHGDFEGAAVLQNEIARSKDVLTNMLRDRNENEVEVLVGAENVWNDGGDFVGIW